MTIYKKNLIDYFKKNIRKSYDSETLKWALINQGYSRVIVESALEEARKELAEQAPVLKEKPVITHAIIDEFDNPIVLEKPWWKRIFS